MECSNRTLTLICALTLLLASCGTRPPMPSASATPGPTPTDETTTLASLQRVDDYPLYTMRYYGGYGDPSDYASLPDSRAAQALAAQGACGAAWGCSLFAALGDENDRLLGRNFDWQFSPAVLLFTAPPDGYASVSMVDITYLGFDGEPSRHIEELPLRERHPLVDAPYLPFDGMNEKGIAIGMAAVPRQPMPQNPQHATIGQVQVMREVLDHAATLEEAIGVLAEHNIDMGSVPIHYLIASAAGESALVEFYQGEMVVFRNEADWQVATNFLVASTDGEPAGHCWRYDHISQQMEALHGRIAPADAMDLLGSVSQDNTQWSVVYHLTSGDVEVVMGRGYGETAHTFHLADWSE